MYINTLIMLISDLVVDVYIQVIFVYS